ncbi:hypothetical protein ECEC4437_3210, partial [Escherichia coli EC4437]
MPVRLILKSKKPDS